MPLPKLPLPWAKNMRKKRSVERDYKFYDPPLLVWDKMNRKKCKYTTENLELYALRDLAFMCLLYLSACRISELVRAKVKGGSLASVKKIQFVKIGDYIMLRNVPVLKRMGVKEISEYPLRNEIPLPLKGGLETFTHPITEFLDTLEPDEELFKFKRIRGYQIVNHITGEFPHYFREMGLKMWLKMFDKDIVRLKEFSGHATLENLARYLRSTWQESSQRILNSDIKDL